MSGFDKIGFVGVGNMGAALIEGVIKAKIYSPEQVHIFDTDTEVMEEVAGRFSVHQYNMLTEMTENVDILLTCVKPDVVTTVLNTVTGVKNIISIAAGITLDSLKEAVSKEVAVIRVMPNTPAQIGLGMSFIAPGSEVGADFLAAAEKIFKSVGKTAVVDEEKIDVATALSGSGPAYVFYFLEALEEAGIYLGLDAETAHIAAGQTLLGAAKLAVESDCSPGELRRQVSSPGGTTVEAIKCLDDAGVKGKIIEAVRSAWKKSRQLARENGK